MGDIVEELEFLQEELRKEGVNVHFDIKMTNGF
jgi:hypothetical protein